MSWKGFEQIIIDTRIKQKITCRPKRGGIHSLDHIGLKSVNHEHTTTTAEDFLRLCLATEVAIILLLIINK